MQGSASVRDVFGILPSVEASIRFTSKKFCKIEIVAFSFVFDKYCPIMD